MPVVVAFLSQKGGVGKSTLARALAAVAAEGGLSVTIADLDPDQQSLAQWEKTRQGNESLPTLRVEAFDHVEDALAACADREILIVDSPGRVNRTTLDVAWHAHLVVLPTGPSLDDLYPTVLLLHEFTRAGVPAERLVAALCRVLSQPEEDAARSYIAKAGYEVLPGSIPERTAYREAQNRGRALTETGRKELDDRAYTLIDALLSKVTAVVTARTDIRKPRKRETGV